MRLSLPLRINLISLAFAASVATVVTGLGGILLYRLLSQAAEQSARLAADQLASRADRLIDLDLRFADFLHFENQCDSVIRGTQFLRGAALFNEDAQSQFHSGIDRLPWPAGLSPAHAGSLRIQDAPQGPVVIRGVSSKTGGTKAFAVVAVDRHAVLTSTLGTVAWLIMGAAAIFVLGAAILLRTFRLQVGDPLERLIFTADNIQPDHPESLQWSGGFLVDDADDIGRLYAALLRLVRRLHEAQAELLRQNELLEATVQQRTVDLRNANAELALDIQRRESLEAELRNLAHTDALTGLANRAFAIPHLHARLALARRNGSVLGIAIIDLDNFKPVNDNYGHMAGDELLQTLALRMRNVCRGSDVIARMGGDEFLVIFEGAHDADDAVVFGHRLLMALSEPVRLAHGSVKIGASIGMALFPLHDAQGQQLLVLADHAMYRAKNSGGGLSLAQPLQPGSS